MAPIFSNLELQIHYCVYATYLYSITYYTLSSSKPLCVGATISWRNLQSLTQRASTCKCMAVNPTGGPPWAQIDCETSKQKSGYNTI